MRFRQAGSLAIADEREIVEYRLVSGDLSSVTDTVNEEILEGWQPFGAISHVTVAGMDRIEHKFCQPIVKYKADDIKSSKTEAESQQGE